MAFRLKSTKEFASKFKIEKFPRIIFMGCARRNAELAKVSSFVDNKLVQGFFAFQIYPKFIQKLVIKDQFIGGRKENRKKISAKAIYLGID